MHNYRESVTHVFMIILPYTVDIFLIILSPSLSDALRIALLLSQVHSAFLEEALDELEGVVHEVAAVLDDKTAVYRGARPKVHLRPAPCTRCFFTWLSFELVFLADFFAVFFFFLWSAGSLTCGCSGKAGERRRTMAKGG